MTVVGRGTVWGTQVEALGVWTRQVGEGKRVDLPRSPGPRVEPVLLLRTWTRLLEPGSSRRAVARAAGASGPFSMWWKARTSANADGAGNGYESGSVLQHGLVGDNTTLRRSSARSFSVAIDSRLPRPPKKNIMRTILSLTGALLISAMAGPQQDTQDRVGTSPTAADRMHELQEAQDKIAAEWPERRKKLLEESRAAMAAGAKRVRAIPGGPDYSELVPDAQSHAAEFAGTKDAVPFLIWIFQNGGGQRRGDEIRARNARRETCR